MTDPIAHPAGTVVLKSGIYNVRFTDDKEPKTVKAVCIKGEHFISARPAEFSLSQEAEYQGHLTELHPWTP